MLNLRIELNPLAEPHVSGVGQYTKRLAEALHAHPDTKVTGFYFDPVDKRPVPDTKTPYVALRVSQRIYAKLTKFGVYLPFDTRLPRVDATIFPNFMTWSTRKSQLKITTIHDLTYLRFPETVEPKNLTFLRKQVPRTLKKADLILTVSETIKQEILNEFDISNDKILALPIPPSQTFAKFKPNKKALAPSLKINTKYFILFVGNFEPRKNLSVLVQAYLLLPEKVRQKCSLVIAGAKGWKNNETQNTIDQAIDNGENIIQTGNLSQTQVAQLMSEATALVMPSIYEGYGMPVSEAMAVKTPVICSDIPVLHESSGESALFFDPNSPKQLAKCIAKLILDKKLRQKLILAGTKHISKLSWSENANKLVRKIEQLLEADEK